MAAKKGGGKKGKDKKEEQSKPTKSQYLGRIAEMNAVLAQIRRETFDVTEVHNETDKRFERMKEDMTDVVKYLEHEMKVCDDEVATYDLAIGKHTTEMQKQKKHYEQIFVGMDEEFETKQRELSEKIQSVNAKLNSFEEMRRQREDFVKRQETLLQLTEEMNLRHKQEIYDAEKQAIIEQDKLQKEMEKRLAQLALDLREATDIRIGETTNRIVGENIKLANMLSCQQEILSAIKDSYTNMKKVQRHATLDLELKQGEYDMTFEKYEGHSGRIDELLQVVEDLTAKIEDLKSLVKINRRMKRKIGEQECLLRDVTSEHNALTKSMEQIEESTQNAKGNLSHFQKNIIKLESTLFETAKKVKDAIKCENIVVTENVLYETITEGEAPVKRENLNEVQEIENENIYRRRELLVEEILTKLCSGFTSTDDLHMTASSIDSYETNFSHRSSTDYSPISKSFLREEERMVPWAPYPPVFPQQTKLDMDNSRRRNTRNEKSSAT